MAKKVDRSVTNHVKIEKKYDDLEDKEIKKVANDAFDKYDKFILCSFFFFMLISLITVLIVCVNNENNIFSEDKNIIEIKKYKDNILIINEGYINENITNEKFGEDSVYKIEKIISIQLKSDKNNEDSEIFYNLKYNILENDFEKNIIANNNSNVLIKFSYSYDKKNWKAINNVISTSESTINPLMGKSYDISGIIDNLKILTNYSLKAEDGSVNKIYWKSETIFQNKDNKNLNNHFKANFKIEYLETE